ncbi:MAG: hypothetical protein AAGF88_04335 [Pseudomonadota bacterium]
MTVFANVLSAPVKGEHETSREDIFLMCRLFREDRIARLAIVNLQAVGNPA